MMKKLVKLKSMYVEWVQDRIDSQKLNKTRVYEYNKQIKGFLEKVNEN
jgi:hypothetical protein